MQRGGSCQWLKKCVELKKVFPRVYKEELQSFEKANLNMLRLIVYYGKDVIAKEKCKSVYKATSRGLCVLKLETVQPLGLFPTTG